ncbi:MAG: 16S rRNA (guanine(527)-N(7))-methyltransferase RsmG [Ilumatobacteraceae bacterium]
MRTAQRLGFVGARPVEEVVEHARHFVEALDGIVAVPGDELGATRRPRVVDIGSGGGVPGLVIANDRPDLAVTLVDRRQKRTDFLQRAVGALGYGGWVTVRCCDTDALLAAGERFDAVTARGFGPPSRTLRTAAGLVRPGGRIVISEPPAGDRWPAREVAKLGLAHRRHGRVAVFEAVPGPAR